ncbi:MAG: enoyl-CoA hydratase-related protein [Pseudomonadota bacterium]
MIDPDNYTRMALRVEDRVGWMTLNQPDEYNRMPPAFWDELPRALAAFDEPGTVRALVIASTGKHFTAGMDVAVFTESRSTPKDPGRAGEAARRRLANIQSTINAVEAVRMPVIAAIQGGCVGGGVDLASACDLRYCTSDAFFCVQEINIGLAADIGTLQRLPKLIPEGMMRELAYTGRRMYADEAKDIGLVNAVFETQEAMLDAVAGIAGQIASKSPLAITSTKQLLNYGRNHSIDDTLQFQQLWMGAMTQGPEMRRHFEAKAAGTEADYDDLPPLTVER